MKEVKKVMQTKIQSTSGEKNYQGKGTRARLQTAAKKMLGSNN